MGEGKSTLRKNYLKIRNEMSLDEREKASITIKDKLIENERVLAADRVFLFASVKTEVSTDVLIERLLEAGKTVAIPKVLENGKMEFYRISSVRDLKPGFKDIPEPAGKEEDLIVPTRKDIMVLPGASFDKSGNRIGYGGGYYDKYLSRHKKSKPYRIGICFEKQLSEKRLPTDLHDTRVDAVVTEAAFLDVRAKNIFMTVVSNIVDVTLDLLFELLRD
ncbi:MAG: 5-formyltetrahydrofolate cyclo-ligase [Lachnospiraceae bacterium]|nr:5-formyltetrahydrofolate cyclo-ligase [Lachnospiraceae bacterium]